MMFDDESFPMRAIHWNRRASMKLCPFVRDATNSCLHGFVLRLVDCWLMYLFVLLIQYLDHYYSSPKSKQSIFLTLSIVVECARQSESEKKIYR